MGIVDRGKDGLDKALDETEGKHVSYGLKHLGGIRGVLDALEKVVRASTSLGLVGRVLRVYEKRARMVSIRLFMRPKGNTLATG